MRAKGPLQLLDMQVLPRKGVRFLEVSRSGDVS